MVTTLARSGRTRPRTNHGVALAFDAEPRRAQAATELVARCDAELLAAQLASDPSERFIHAHLAALRIAGAVLAVSQSKPPRGRPRSAWDRLAAEGDDFAAWAGFFSSGARVRAAIDAGQFDRVDDEFAARWVAAAEDFRDAVCAWLDSDVADGVGSVAPTPTPGTVLAS